MARGSRLFHLARQSDRLAGAHANASAHRLSATCLYSVYTRGRAGPMAVVAETALRGLSVLRFPDLPGPSGVLHRVHPCACARATFLPRPLTAFALARRMGSGRDAGSP